jgi:hypothetical protein
MALPEIMSSPDLTRKETSDDMAVSPAGAARPLLTMINPTHTYAIEHYVAATWHN